ncbi:arsenate reductase [Methylobacter sp. S3L5C]|uniref:arsenate reductase n=1 Tax=Methylobacter sp. S3L5C TaxID=2839024 RepID=UPI001FAD4300|nr:arsenate reductase [Methylobacter sp. S3L5C]UOA09486.1 arsenate reductase [Methylobacter sp. S3L5C]
MYTLYGIKNCDTVKKARQWLDQNGIAYQFHDFRTDGLTSVQLNNFATRVDWNTLLNRSSTSWQLSAEQQSDLTAEKAIALMVNTPTLIKRPVLDTGDKLIIGFTTKDGGYAAHLPEAGKVKPDHNQTE